MFREEKFVQCQICGKFVSENAVRCPYCDSLLKKKPSNGNIIISCLTIFLSFFIFMFGLTTFLGADCTNEKGSSVVRDTTISMAEFNKIQTGMTYSEVVSIIGTGGELMSQADIGYAEYATKIYSWNGNGGTGSNATIMFQGGKVVSKAQFGLK